MRAAIPSVSGSPLRLQPVDAVAGKPSAAGAPASRYGRERTVAAPLCDENYRHPPHRAELVDTPQARGQALGHGSRHKRQHTRCDDQNHRVFCHGQTHTAISWSKPYSLSGDKRNWQTCGAGALAGHRPQAHQADHRPELVEYPHEDRQPGGAGDPEMELIVQVDEVVRRPR